MRTPHSLIALVVLAALTACRPIVKTALSLNVPHSPSGVRFSYADVDRFSAALAQLDSTRDTVAALRAYVRSGSRGFKAYAKQFGVNDSTMLAAMRRRPAYYSSLRDLPTRLRAQEPQVRDGLAAMERLYAGTVYPPVWYVVGNGRAGGQASRTGVLVGADLFAANADSAMREALGTPRSFRVIDELAALVAHETVHYNHFVGAPFTYSKQWDSRARALKEGSADFIAQLATGRNTNSVAHAYGDQHERDLWTDFRPTLDSNITAPWFFGARADGKPSALGYYIGYRIVDSYYRRAKSPDAAVRAIMELSDYKKFLAQSAYQP